MDYSLERLINGPAGSIPFLDTIMIVVAGGGVVLLASLVVGWFGVGLIRCRSADRLGAIGAVVAVAVALAVNHLMALAWARPRPFVSHPSVHLLLPQRPDASFPSDHAAVAFAIAIVVLLVRRRRLGVGALLLAAWVAYARVYAGVHYPADVAGGGLVGSFAGVMVMRPFRVIPTKILRVGDFVLIRLHLLPNSDPGSQRTSRLWPGLSASALILIVVLAVVFYPREKVTLARGECKPGTLLGGVYFPDRLTVESSCTTVTGTVDCVKQEPDGDIHIRLRVDAPYSGLLTNANAAQKCAGQTEPHLVVEIIPQNGRPPFPENSADRGGFITPSPPMAGDHVSVTGPYVWDSNALHDLLYAGQNVKDWAEIHPAWNISVDSQRASSTGS